MNTRTLSIAQHQNGFIKVALPLGGRLHVWSPWNPPVDGPVADVHDHPFAFTSTVLAGEMQNVLLHAIEDVDGDHVENTAACVSSFGPQPGLLASARRVRLVEDGVVFVRRGEMYSMKPWQLHRTDAVFALTLFRKGEQAEGHSRVYSQVGLALREFRPAHEDLLRMSLDRALDAAKLTIDDVVEIEAAQRTVTIGDAALQRQPFLTAPGYHARVMPKSPHGTAGKVVEESLELAEADEQGVPIMALCECADVVGAVRAYVQRTHPSVSFEDVVKMVDVTERAFRTGKRK